MKYEAFKVTKGAAVPVATQLADHFRNAILDGTMNFGAALPRADSIRHASRMTVLHAYRILQSEGIVRMRPRHGTIVTYRGGRGFYGLLVNRRAFICAGGTYYGQLLAAVMNRATYGSKPARIYAIDAPEDSEEGIDEYIPNSLKSDVMTGLLRGAFTFTPTIYPAVHKWLTDRNVPCISAGFFEPASRFEFRAVGDRDGMFRDLLKHPRVVKAGAVEIWSSQPMPEFLAVQKRTAVRWRPVDLHDHNAADCGREVARSVAAETPRRRHPTLIEDDWIAIAAVMELRRLGRRVPESVHVIASTNNGQTEGVLRDCDRYVLDIEALSSLMVEMLDKAAAGTPSTERTATIRLIFKAGRSADGK